MIIYDGFPVTADGPPPTPEFLAAYHSEMTLIRETCVDVEVRPHASPLSLKTVLSGEEVYTFGRRETSVRPGGCLLTPAKAWYGSYVPRGDATRSLSLHFPEALVREALTAAFGNIDATLEGNLAPLSIAVDAPPHRRTPPPAIAAAFARLATATSSVEAEPLALTLAAWAASLLREAHDATQSIPAVRPAVRRELFRRAALAREAIDAAPSEAWTMRALARVACVSPFHLHRIFVAAFGVTPADHLRQARMSEAVRLLQRTDLPVRLVAAQVGFDNFSAFSRRFRRDTGLTPTEFRRSQGRHPPALDAAA